MEINAAPSHIVCVLKSPNKKDLSVNGLAYERLSLHIGKFPCVMVVPDDIEIINGSSEVRRKLIDVLLSQLYPEYLQSLITYNKLLQQRNSFLKSIIGQHVVNFSLLDVFDEQMHPPAVIIHKHRKDLSEELLPIIKKFYHLIAGVDEPVQLFYRSSLNQIEFPNLLRQNPN